MHSLYRLRRNSARKICVAPLICVLVIVILRVLVIIEIIVMIVVKIFGVRIIADAVFVLGIEADNALLHGKGQGASAFSD